MRFFSCCCWNMYVSAPLRSTTKESWTGDAHHSDGSKNHPMFTGGAGVWLWESGLGLRITHRAYVGQTQDSKIDFEEADRCLRSSSLGFDPRIHVGLSSRQAAVACALAEKLTATRVLSASTRVSLDELRDHVKAAGISESLSTPLFPGLRPVVTLAPSSVVMETVGAADGWSLTPQGRVEASWVLHHTGTISMKLIVPNGGTQGRVAIPLSLIRATLLPTAPGTAVVAGISPRLVVRVSGVTMLDAALHVVLAGNALPPGCKQIQGTVYNGDAIAVCNDVAQVPTMSTVSEISRMAIASWAEVEGEGRTGTMATTTWASGALLLEMGWGAWDLTLLPAQL